MAEKSKVNTEKKILQQARKIFIKNGYAGTRMQAIADAANINKAMLHYYFRNKDMLFLKILESSVTLMASNIIPALIGKKPVIEKLENLVHIHINTTIENPHIPMFILSEMTRGQKNFQVQLKSKMMENGVLFSFMNQIQKEQDVGILKQIPPKHVILTVMSLLTFPFLAKPVFTNLLEIPETEYTSMMHERKIIVMNILRSALIP
ncbi:TetR/AcrR family transcriptional regulator [Kordia jejudonensis]|uniref:TetR/AcrR family transcriptional regulator n=1 Tax=Kordia jejudonensis TaxID=1348245 RepID=UPI0006291BF1|nr:TetR/AcrR family transcriptional regulator [Kordia jejudonensis]